MLLWRVGSNALPTKDNLMIRMDINNPCNLLCNHELEFPLHLFFKCPAAKALWFTICWGFKADQVPLNSHLDIVKLILCPPASLCHTQDQWIVSFNTVLTIEEIWHIRNAMLQQASTMDLHQNILSNYHKFTLIISQLEPSKPMLNAPKWSHFPPPPPGSYQGQY